MTNHQDDDMNHERDAADVPLDPRLIQAAHGYNAPPATPREAMWERIAAARAAAPRSVAEAPAVRVIPLAPRSSRDGRAVRRPAWALPLAAALLLGVGIGVGRLSVSRDDAPGTSPVATTPAPMKVGGSGTEPIAPSRPGQLAVGGAEGAGRTGTPPSSASRGALTGAESPEPIAEGGTASESLAYRLATAEHLMSTETLLATISADAKAGRADSSVAAWARDLLGTTRVLLDSPAGRDPKTARLLEDLELVLAQVAQLPAGRGAEELQSIERAVRRRDVMTRVRAAIPTGPLSAGT